MSPSPPSRWSTGRGGRLRSSWTCPTEVSSTAGRSGRPALPSASAGKLRAKKRTRDAAFRIRNRDQINSKQNAHRALYGRPLKSKHDAAYRTEHRERDLSRKAAYHAANSETVNRKRLLKRYAVTEAQLTVLINDQAGGCAICREPLRNGYQTHVDHDHMTGRVRGILCRQCNLGLGHFMDSAARLEAALLYLRRTP